MTDARLRELERAAGNDPAAAERLRAEEIRAQRFRRDPRVDPRDGDAVEVRGVRRGVSQVWPRELDEPITATPRLPEESLAWTIEARSEWLRRHCDPSALTRRLQPGTVVRSAFLAIGGWLGLWAESGLELVRFEADFGSAITPREAFRSRPPQAGVELREVDYCTGNILARRTVDIEAWRRWARRGRVVRVGS